ncbi:zinc finger protein [Macleaya cordata]|uniref:Zinc finger protein n=1 Tax=Macleaya cordata TaxID=56857 RepID=A0A200R7T0_MACCD|nr:zinc finger protein [Macleaya cordata]
MHRCSSSHCNNQVGPCSCGLFHTSSSNNSSFSMFFSNPNKPYDEFNDPYSMTTSSSSSVDCTLSLGTPSTRKSNTNNNNSIKRSSASSIWDIFQTKQLPSSTPSSHSKSGSRGVNSSANLNNLNGDPLLARRCANCDTTSTPLWRNGPRGPKSLCNACGIRYKKEERRASSTTTTTTTGGATAAASIDQQYLMGHHHHQYSWAHQQQMTNQKVSHQAHHHLGNEFMFVQSDDQSDPGIPFLSWRLNVPERSGLNS